MEWIAGHVPSHAWLMLPILGSLHFVAFAISRRRLGLIAFGIGLLLFFALVYYPLMAVLPSLSIASFREATNFDPQEAAFYLKTILRFSYGALNWHVLGKWTVTFISYAALFIFASRLVRSHFGWVTPDVLTAVAIAGLVLLPTAVGSIEAWRGFAEANLQIDQAARSFAGNPARLKVDVDPHRKLSVVLYIGESSSRLHWGLYGYPRRTTPELDELRRQGDLIAFDHVTATFPYTSNSLLEALSIAKSTGKTSSGPVPIFEQPRYSIVDVLSKAGISTLVYSNQARHGSWNLASEMIFRHARVRRFSTDRTLGNLDFLDDDRPYDHVYLRQFLTTIASQPEGTDRLLVFHSYAGHGDYQNFLPEDRLRPVDSYFSDVSEQAVLGSGPAVGTMGDLEAYDSAMRYVSGNIARAIAAVDRMTRATVLVYFSDHGDSAFTGLGHDAARYTWAMGAVPFVIHFNPAAKRDYPKLVDRYRRLAAGGADESLANVSSLLFDLLGVSVGQPDGNPHPVNSCKFGSGNCLPRYLVAQRSLDEKITYVASPAAPMSAPPGTEDITARITAQYNLARRLEHVDGSPLVCVHRNNSLARVIRARAITDCLEMDVVVREDGAIAVYHPPANDVGLSLAKAVSAIGDRPTTIWLDSKNIDDPAACNRLARFVQKRAGGNLDFLVEFPPESAGRIFELRPCLATLERSGAFRSFYVPTELATSCAREREGSRSCRQLHRALLEVVASGAFSDLSFEFAGLPAIVRSPAARGLRWNTWFIPDRRVIDQTTGRFRLAIPNSGELNVN